MVENDTELSALRDLEVLLAPVTELSYVNDVKPLLTSSSGESKQLIVFYCVAACSYDLVLSDQDDDENVVLDEETSAETTMASFENSPSGVVAMQGKWSDCFAVYEQRCCRDHYVDDCLARLRRCTRFGLIACHYAADAAFSPIIMINGRLLHDINTYECNYFMDTYHPLLHVGCS